MNFRDKTVVVTGAGSGMGQHLTWQLLSRGARVAAVDIKQENLDSTHAGTTATDRLSLHVLDVRDADGIRALPAQVVAAHGGVDVIINNAGIIQPFVKVADLDDATIARVFDVNFFGTLNMVRAFLPLLLARPEAHIANVSSMGGFLPVPGQAIYGASKAAVKLMTEALYAELMETRVGVSVILPGAVETNIMINSDVTMPHAPEGDYHSLPAEEAAQIILEGIEAGDLHITVGKDSLLMNLANRIAPEASIRLIQRQMKNLLEHE